MHNCRLLHLSEGLQVSSPQVIFISKDDVINETRLRYQELFSSSLFPPSSSTPILSPAQFLLFPQATVPPHPTSPSRSYHYKTLTLSLHLNLQTLFLLFLLYPNLPMSINLIRNQQINNQSHCLERHSTTWTKTKFGNDKNRKKGKYMKIEGEGRTQHRKTENKQEKSKPTTLHCNV